jgi:hypothetical protein
MTRPLSHPPRGLPGIFAVPALLALVTLAGLVIGLAGDGWHDMACALLLALPILALARAWAGRR